MMTRPMIDNPYGGRSVEEWIGKTPDTKVPDRIRDRVFARAKGVCHLSGRKIAAGEKWELEHKKALAFGGEHREANLAPALVAAHREKTSQEVSDLAKADRMGRKHRGTWAKPIGNARMPSRPFPKSRRSGEEHDHGL